MHAVRAYVLATAVVFGAVTVAHLWRVTVEPHLLREPWYAVVTGVAATLCAWGIVLLRRPRR